MIRRLLIYPIVILLALISGAGLYAYHLLTVATKPPQAVVVTVAPGSSLSGVARELEDKGVVDSALALRLIARWKQLESRIQAGSYRFEKMATAEEVFYRLVRGDVEKVNLTIPEGFTLEQIIERISQKGYGRRERLRQLCHDSEFIASLKIEADSLEGYLFPETYHFAPGNNEAQLLTMLVDQFFAQISSTLIDRAENLGLTLHQLVTLASIIEKETGVIDEMPLISSVFHNRLKRGIPLQTDPTVIYGIKNFDGNITRKHLKTPTPYNTYIIRGLPPGPIASPGLAALNAAADPAQTKYLYFVARGDGSHQFSKTLVEHNEAVRKFQLRGKRS